MTRRKSVSTELYTSVVEVHIPIAVIYVSALVIGHVLAGELQRDVGQLGIPRAQESVADHIGGGRIFEEIPSTKDVFSHVALDQVNPGGTPVSVVVGS
jgi:hypothetical protein